LLIHNEPYLRIQQQDHHNGTALHEQTDNDPTYHHAHDIVCLYR